MAGQVETLRTKLLLSSAVAMLPFAYGGRAAQAGVCAYDGAPGHISVREQPRPATPPTAGWRTR